MIWLAFVVNLVIAVSLIAVGAAVVRRAAKGPAFLLIAAGALELVGVCCVQGIHLGSDSPSLAGRDVMYLLQASMLGTTCLDVIVVGMVVAALWGLAKGLRQTASAGP